MKYISVLFFAAALAWSWQIVHGNVGVPFETHSAIQNDLARVLIATIQAQKPEATEVRMDRVWTELLTGGKVKAHFAYSYTVAPDSEGKNSENNLLATRNQVEGSGILERVVADAADASQEREDKWILKEILIQYDRVEFKEPLVVSSVRPAAQEGSSPNVPADDEASPPTPAKSEH